MGAGTALLLAGAAFFAGALNSIAGGGSFLTFPSLLLAGIGPVQANATSTVALWPGALASAAAYRHELAAERAVAGPLALSSLVGGGIGALLLVYTPPSVFERMVPYLLLAATLLFTLGPRLRGRAAAFAQAAETPPRPLVAALVQAPIAIYGGYFGGGIGMMMLAAFALLGMGNLHRMNALKTLLVAAVNGVAVVTFVFARVVAWAPAALMLVAGVAGGYLGAAIARRAAPARVRVLVLVIGWAMTGYFFVRG